MYKLLRLGPLFVIAAALLWSFDGLLRISLYSLPPAVIVFFEHTLGALVLLPIIPKWFSDVRKMTKGEWLAIGIVSIFSGALGTILYTTALSMIQYASYSVVVLLQQQLQPIWAMAAATIILKERLTKKFLFWAGIALVAAYFISFRDLSVNLQTGTGTAAAALLAISAGFMWGSSTAISKYVLKRASFLTTTALRFFIAPLFAFIIIVVLNQTSFLYSITSAQWQTLLLITFTTGLVALSFYYYGLKKTQAKIATICELVWPASAILIDYFVFKKTLSGTQIFGIVLLLIAIYQVTKNNSKN